MADVQDWWPTDGPESQLFNELTQAATTLPSTEDETMLVDQIPDKLYRAAGDDIYRGAHDGRLADTTHLVQSPALLQDHYEDSMADGGDMFVDAAETNEEIFAYAKGDAQPEVSGDAASADDEMVDAVEQYASHSRNHSPHMMESANGELTAFEHDHIPHSRIHSPDLVEIADDGDDEMADGTCNHAIGECSHSPGASTPPSSPNRHNNASSESNDEITGAAAGATGNSDNEGGSVASSVDEVDLHAPVFSRLSEQELLKQHKSHKALHKKAAGLIPHQIAAQRYWIAVLNHSLTPRDVRKEKDFLWIKGHRLNTVETVWHTYQNATATNDFRLEIHDEVAEMELPMEDLDFYNDKLVVFRALLPFTEKDGVSAQAPIFLDD